VKISEKGEERSLQLVSDEGPICGINVNFILLLMINKTCWKQCHDLSIFLYLIILV